MASGYSPSIASTHPAPMTITARRMEWRVARVMRRAMS